MLLVWHRPKLVVGNIPEIHIVAMVNRIFPISKQWLEKSRAEGFEQWF